MLETVQFIITSGAYISGDMVAEFGKLPPSFLPLGNRRLYQWQLDSIEGFEAEIHLSIPDDFFISEHEQILLENRGVRIHRIKGGLSLKDSILELLGRIDLSKRIRILHGDTLVGEIDFSEDDVFSENITDQYCTWAEYRPSAHGKEVFEEGLIHGSKPRSVVSGYFSFSDGKVFRDRLLESDNFIASLNSYAVDHKLKPVEPGTWLDFGHTNTYYLSRATALASRDFNHVERDMRVVTKRSTQTHKIDAEACWFEEVPCELKIYLPHYLGRTKGKGPSGYRLEYLYQPTLNDLYVFGRLPETAWERILTACKEFLDMCGSNKPVIENAGLNADVFYQKMIIDKTWQRMEEFVGETEGISMDADLRFRGKVLPSLKNIVESLVPIVCAQKTEALTVMHGDLCFSNIFYDFRTQNIRVIDPRGLIDEHIISPYGSILYDLAKLSHSVVGYYDHIVAGMYSLDYNPEGDFDIRFPNDMHDEDVEAFFRDMQVDNVRAGSESIQAMMILLFISMLPLHKDSKLRQQALLVNALRLYSENFS